MSMQQPRWFQHLLKELYEYSGTKLSQGCSAIQEKYAFGYSKGEDLSKVTLTSGKGVRNYRNRIGIENSKERESLASPANMKVGELVVSTPSVRVYFSPL